MSDAVMHKRELRNITLANYEVIVITMEVTVAS